jgi:phage baseplate assembly protein gpV
MADRYPLVIDTSNQNQIKEIPNGDNLLLTGNSITGAVNITASNTVTTVNMNVTGDLTYRGTVLASLAVSGDYADLTGAPTLLSQFTNDVDFRSSGDNISVFTNDIGYLTTVSFNDLSATPTTLGGYGITDAATSIQGSLATTALQPGANISTLNNDSQYVTLPDLQNGVITVDVNNSGDLVGSVFADDSTVMIDSILASVNLNGTIRGNVVPNANQHNTWDLGSNAVRFKDAYFAGTIYGDGSNLTGINTGDTIGNFTLSASVIDTDDSSAITITPAVVMNSDLTVENSLTVNGDINSEGVGIPELFSESEIKLTASTTSRVSVTQSALRFANFTDAQRDALTAQNGDMIYNTDDNRYQVYQNGSWVRLDTSPIV